MLIRLSSLSFLPSFPPLPTLRYITVFGLVWFFGLLNRTIQDLAHSTQFWALFFHVLFVPLQGFLNAIVYGGLLETRAFKNFKAKAKRCCGFGGVGEEVQGLHRPASYTPPSYMSTRSQPRGPWSSLPASSKKSVSLFVSTYNLAEKDFSELTGWENWLPTDSAGKHQHDLYVVGVQECMCLPQLRAALLSHLGGPSSFTMFTAEIGSTNTNLGFHGLIAVTVFARTEDVVSGAFYSPHAMAGDIRKGADLIVVTAPNKVRGFFCSL